MILVASLTTVSPGFAGQAIASKSVEVSGDSIYSDQVCHPLLPAGARANASSNQSPLVQSKSRLPIQARRPMKVPSSRQSGESGEAHPVYKGSRVTGKPRLHLPTGDLYAPGDPHGPGDPNKKKSSSSRNSETNAKGNRIRQSERIIRFGILFCSLSDRWKQDA